MPGWGLLKNNRPSAHLIAPSGQHCLRLKVVSRVFWLLLQGTEVPEKDFARALRHGAKEARKLLLPQLELAAKAG